MNKIAVCIKHYSMGKSSPVICLLDGLSVYYDQVDIYAMDVWCTKAYVLDKENIRLVELKSHGAGIRGMVSRIGSLFVKPELYDDDYSNYLCFDPHGLVLCHELFPAARPFYYSLELYFRDNHYNLPYPRSVMKKDRALVHNIRGLIVQSEEREQLFRKEYGLSPAIPTFFLPVTYLQPSSTEKSLLLRDKYSILKEKKVALHLGGIQGYFSCIEIALAFAELEDWVLIFHGSHFGEYIESFRKILEERKIANVFISDAYYDYIEEMDPLLMSCDVGIAWYNDVSLNFTTSGKSSGKISAYLRFGLPVVAKRYPSTITAIEDPGCGVCIDDFDGFKDALRRISTDYDSFSANSIKEYNAVYFFENYRENLIRFLNS